MLEESNVFKAENILNCSYISLNEVPDKSKVPYGEPNTGSWYREDVRHFCTSKNHFLLNIEFFIDELKIDKFD